MAACPNARGLSLKKPLPVRKKSLANDINMNIQNFGIGIGHNFFFEKVTLKIHN
jgi:hypothetical protein